jgi:acylphosphatase
MTENLGIHCYVTGKVQGVWFRASTKEQADQLGITGWAKNLPDGRVEVLAFGDRKRIMHFYDWLKQGPPLAQVIGISYEEIPWEMVPDFCVL